NRSVLNMQIKDGTDERTGKAITHEMSTEEFVERLQQDGVNYLYLHHVDAEFAGRYGSLFADGVPIGEGKLYRVDPDSSRPVCELLGE
ncbi:MAG: hypothetical protein IK096_07810, partial [Lachnospiraceae bacterium]|nr:hypothetical protein [Lachnospiraceae bacterium]